MKNKILIFLLGITIFSCKNDVKQNGSSTSETENISAVDTLSLRLNNGEKWSVNDATIVGVSKMDSILQAFNAKEEKNYAELGQNLSTQTSYIIKSCDMTGEAHDQLHVVLVPMLDEIYELKDSNDLDENKKSAQSLEALIKAYYKHFQ